ncbi:MAG TPA: glycosyltransferase family 4 protein [Acidimicrobiales bacterium]|nr:glycosyltransferase family 4 protein [Acidimicrobiales bacterium]
MSSPRDAPDLHLLTVREGDLEVRRPMRIGLIAPPWVPVPPPVYGGTELVVAELAAGFHRAGCEVRLFATGDSTSPVPTEWHFPHALGTEFRPDDELAHVAAAYRSLHDVDLIHDHTVSGALWAAQRGVTIPLVTTVHGELTGSMGSHYARMATEGIHIVAISESQRQTAPWAMIESVIHHGIEVDRFPVGAGDGGYVLFLGRMHPDKGPHRAVEAARLAGVPIRLAAKMREPAEHRYFADVVEPMLGPDAVYLGEVSQRDKVDLLAGAMALVNPIRWPEPFGLVMIEAMACGTPVLTFPEGAAPEIVEDGETGFLCGDVEGLADAIRRVGAGALQRAACRERAVEHFSTERMVREHLALYQRVLASGDQWVEAAST